MGGPDGSDSGGEGTFVTASPAEKLYKEGFQSLLLGTFHEVQDTISPLILIYYKTADQKLKETLGDEKLVVLS